MSANYYYDVCCRHMGRPVEITTKDGRCHRGMIQHVDRNNVYLQPLGSGKNFGGFGYGYGPYGPYGGFGGYGGGFGPGIALGSIATLALLPLFF